MKYPIRNGIEQKRMAEMTRRMSQGKAMTVDADDESTKSVEFGQTEAKRKCVEGETEKQKRTGAEDRAGRFASKGCSTIDERNFRQRENVLVEMNSHLQIFADEFRRIGLIEENLLEENLRREFDRRRRVVNNRRRFVELNFDRAESAVGRINSNRFELSKSVEVKLKKNGRLSPAARLGVVKAEKSVGQFVLA